jgi:hypothetical protein
VYLYAICDGAAAEPETTGLHGQALRAIREAGLSAVVGDGAPAGKWGETELWQHEDAIELLMRSRDLLPARFGTVLAGDAEVRGLLARRREQLSSALRRVAGAVELSVRALWREAALERPAADGTGYLHARLDAERRAGALARLLNGRLAPLARVERIRVCGAARTPVAGSYLLDREAVEEFASELDRLDGETADAMFVCTGPWPPYSFVQPEADER